MGLTTWHLISIHAREFTWVGWTSPPPWRDLLRLPCSLQVSDLGCATWAAELAVRATRYPQLTGAPDYEPQGLRGRNPSNAQWYWGIRDYHAKADVWPLDPQGELLSMMFIESAEGVENIDDIITVPGLGAIFIGPSDLSTSMGYASPAAPQIEAAIQTVLRACLDNDVPCAITTGAGSVQQRINEGFRFVTVGADGGLNAGASNALRLGREAAGR